MANRDFLDFHQLLSGVDRPEVIASGRGVRIRNFLDRVYGPGKWRKMKGIATVELHSGEVRKAEVHYYEAHGIGRVRFKVKRTLD